MNIVDETSEVLQKILSLSELQNYVDKNLPIPKVYKGSSEIKLVILGQDPTVKTALSRKNINTVLNLNKPGQLTAYLCQLCSGLSLSIDNVYATNLLKNFFINPPTTYKEISIFQKFLPMWLPVLKKELAQYPDIPIITLGEPVLQAIINNGAKRKVREYWNYENCNGSFCYLKANENILERDIFPFPHQPSIHKEFYKQNLKGYTQFLATFI